MTNHETSDDWLGQLFDDQYTKLFRLARRLSNDPEEACDLVQETFLRAARMGALPAGGAAEAWLVRILVNLCRDQHRRAVVRSKASDLLREQEPKADPGAASLARLTVQAALQKLGPRRRAIVVLHDLEGKDVREIARLFGVTPATIRWHLARGRNKLAKTLLGRPATRQERRS